MVRFHQGGLLAYQSMLGWRGWQWQGEDIIPPGHKTEVQVRFEATNKVWNLKLCLTSKLSSWSSLCGVIYITTKTLLSSRIARASEPKLSSKSIHTT